MENEKIQNGIKEIKNIKMTPEEKSQILESILNSPIPKIEPIKSPYSFFSLFQKSNLFYYGVAFALIVITISNKETILNYLQDENTQNIKITKDIKKTDPIKKEEIPDKKIAVIKKDEPKNNTGINESPTPNPTLPNPNQGVGGTSVGMMANSDTNPQKYIDTASTLFTKWLTQNRNDILEYRIDKIDFISFKKDISNDAYIVKITYIEKTNSGWSLNKYLFVTIDKNTTEYFIKNTDTKL